jgi:signal transduction histidine kinase
MSTVQTEVVRAKPVRRSAIVIVDGDPKTGPAIFERVAVQFGETYQVHRATESQEAANLLTSLQEEQGVRISAIGVATRVLLNEMAAPQIREKVPPSTRIIAYTDLPLEEVQGPAIHAGASTCVGVDDVESAIHRVFLESELEDLDSVVPTVARVVRTIDVGMSVQTPQMEVLWANNRITSIVDPADEKRRTCWKRYHKFYHRECRCMPCTAWCVLQNAIDQLKDGKDVADGALPGYHLLPVRGGITRIQVNATPVLSRDGRHVLGVLEATRFVTKEWEENTPAHERLYEVIAAARALGQEREGSQPLLSVTVYYRPEENGELHLFDSAAEDLGTVPKLLRLAECAAPYRDVLADGQSRFFAEAGDQSRRHFLWAAQTPSMGTDVLIDVVYIDDKPHGLFTEDLDPYWEYVLDIFDVAWETREKGFEHKTNSALEKFLAGRAKGIRDEASLETPLQAAVECVQEALQPLSMYVRILDRTTNTLVKRNGIGPYYEMAPEKRNLRYEGIGSGKVASRREGYSVKRAEIGEIRQFLDHDLSAAEESQLRRIAGYVALPLVCTDRILGVLCVQFEDDSLFSPAKCRFVKAMASALGSVMGNLEWAHERTAVAKYSKDLDRTMFRRSEHPEEEETSLLAQVTRMVFELTAAEVVAYYRYDAPSRKLSLVTSATQGTLPSGMAIPETLPRDVGVVSLATAKQKGYWVRNYRGNDWQEIRKRLIASFPQGPENEFCHWVGCEIAEPVIAGEVVVGVLVALSSIPDWLSPDDREVLREFAFKTGLCLEAKQLMRKLNWYLRTKISLNDVTAAMARISDASTLYRLFLLAITTDECLGFSRVILFLPQGDDERRLVAAEAVGARSRSVAEVQWKEADATPLKDKMEACAQSPQTRPGDLRELLPPLALDLRQHPTIFQAFKDRKAVVRRRGQPHAIHDAQILAILCPEGNQDGEYVLAPLTSGGAVTGAVLADRAFLMASDIAPERLDLLQLLTGEFAMMLEAIEFRREEQEAMIASELAQGISYSLRTRAAALEGAISNLAYDLGDSHQEAIDSLKRAVEFFERAGTLASKFLRSEEIHISKEERLDLNTVLGEMVDALKDPRITVDRADHPVCVQAERGYIEDVFLEIVWNACDFTDRKTGSIKVTVRADGSMARVECVDNGPGIHPDFRSNLFKRFKCYPASRMGLGLSYAARLVRAYGGTIEEIGVWQQRAHFVVRIPLAEEQENESG